MQQDLLGRYLAVLGVEKQEPSLTALNELVRAHMLRVPFENVSKLYYRKRGIQGLPDLERYLDGIERFHFGGTCYANNYYLYQLLANLGYPATLCGADMSNPDVHLVVMLTLRQRQFMVDAGYAAPFLTPLPRDLNTDYVVTLGRDRYVLKPQDTLGRSRLELYRDGTLKHSYLAKPTPRDIREFERVIAESYREEATFMNALLLARFLADSSIVIHNLTVIESRGTVSASRTLNSREELVRAIAEYFDIPEEVAREAEKQVTRLEDAWK
jgi:arylamine N-acetyltransferase